MVAKIVAIQHMYFRNSKLCDTSNIVQASPDCRYPNSVHPKSIQARLQIPIPNPHRTAVLVGLAVATFETTIPA